MGFWAQADALADQILDSRRSVSSEDDNDTLTTIAKIGALYTKKEQWGRAENVLQELIDRRQKIAGRSDTCTLNTLRNLRFVY